MFVLSVQYMVSLRLHLIIIYLKKVVVIFIGESKLERELAYILDKQNVGMKDLRGLKWLGRQSLDFYLPEHHIAVECQGAQHFKPVDFAGKGLSERERHMPWGWIRRQSEFGL